jgi:two-component system, repressor protein LuxO
MADSVQPFEQAAASPRLLLISDRPDAGQFYADTATQAGFDCVRVTSSDDALARLRSDAPRLAIVDLSLSGAGGLDLLRAAQAEKLETAIVAVSVAGSLRLAVDAMKLGAFDYLAEPLDAARLAGVLREASGQMSISAGEQESEGAARDIAFPGLTGASRTVSGISAAIETATASKATVIITGESGIGKEVCADAIHSASQRGNKPLVTINCAAIPPELIESELFGHVRGAFAGAVSNRTGAATEAHGGTLFLDEICDLTPEAQAKVLRLVEEGTFQRLGSAEAERTDIRVVCATSREPREEVQAGRFRQDLLDRLQGVAIHLPPLRERGNDIMQIATYFKKALPLESGRPGAATAEADAQLRVQRSRDARELQNALYQAVALSGDAPLPSDGCEAEQGDREIAAAGQIKTVRDIKPLWLLEQEAIEEALDICGQNVPKAAAYLEVAVSTIYRKRAEYQAARKQSKVG